MSKDKLEKEYDPAKDGSIIRNKNRIERKIAPFQSEYDRLQVKPSEAGVSLLPSKKRTASQNIRENKNESFIVSRGKQESDNKNIPSTYNSNIDAGAFPFNKKLNPYQKPQEMWATLDGDTSWSGDEGDSENIIESTAPDKIIDNNDYVIIDDNDREFIHQEYSGKDLEEYNQINSSGVIPDIGNYTLLVKNSLVLTNATEEEVQELIEQIIYGDYEDFKDEDLKASDFCVYKRVNLYFGVSILE